MKKPHLYSIIAICLLALTPFSAKADPSYDSFIAYYNQLLGEYTDQGIINNISAQLVDYDGWADDPLHGQALAELLNVDFETFKDNQAMAFWINAYNFLTIDLIITTGERESIKNQGRLWQNVWKRFSWEFQSSEVTLHQIEHEILRPMGDARVHFAINCASLSCPDLKGKAYEPETLDEILDIQASLFLKSPDDIKGAKGYEIRDNDLYISKIFDWFDEDFSSYSDSQDKKDDFQAFFEIYLGKTLTDDLFSGGSIQFLPYDWQLNLK